MSDISSFIIWFYMWLGDIEKRRTWMLTPIPNLSWLKAVGTTSIRITRILCYDWLMAKKVQLRNKKNIFKYTLRFLSAWGERILYISSLTCTSGDVVENSTFCTDTKESRTWIYTLQILTCFVWGAVCIDWTFWSTCYKGTYEVFWNASTCCSFISFLAFSIHYTWRRGAWIFSLCRYFWWYWNR